MIRQTFTHIPGIGAATEAKLWRQGVDDWARADPTRLRLGPRRLASFERCLAESREHYAEGRIGYFADRLPAGQHWRLLPDFRQRIAYLDIETTGFMAGMDHVTTIAVYDGRRVMHYVHGQNLDQFERDIAGYDLLVTYNGKCFDVPFLEFCLGCRLPQAHLDLRYVLKSLGYGGGLKRCEQALGLTRPGLEGVDGYFAVLLWAEYQRTGSSAALETLLAYNVEDVLTLERLAVLAYNAKLEDTPFAATHRLDAPVVAANPFAADHRLIERIRGQMSGPSFARW
ncbi:MAG: ribonuclease H-like domain-containing protein [Phycisphaeraceae bacterium]